MKCANREKDFESKWSDEEAAAEFEQTFYRPPDERDGIVCDDCYQRIMKWIREMSPARRAELDKRAGTKFVDTLTGDE